MNDIINGNVNHYGAYNNYTINLENFKQHTNVNGLVKFIYCCFPSRKIILDNYVQGLINHRQQTNNQQANISCEDLIHGFLEY